MILRLLYYDKQVAVCDKKFLGVKGLIFRVVYVRSLPGDVQVPVLGFFVMGF
jgi:hypothetical protein